MNFRLQAFSCLVGLALGVSACSSDGSAAAGGKKTVTRTTLADSEFQPSDLEKTVNTLVTKIGQTAPVDMQIGVTLKQLNTYFLPIQIGASRAISELNLSGQVVAPQSSAGNDAVVEENDIMNQQLSSGYNGIAVAPFEVGNQPPIDSAADSDVPVVTIDSDLASSKRDLYMGTMNSEAGKTAGTTLTSLITVNSGTVILLGHDDAGWPDGFDRTNGAKAVLEGAGFTVVVRRTDWSETGEAADVDFMKDAITNADPPVVGMMGMFSDAYRCAIAAEAVGKTADDIAIAAFDFEPKTVEFMRSGMIKATHAQRQYYMGYLTPYVLYGFKALGKEATKAILAPQMVDNYRFNTGLDVIPADKLDSYYSYLDKLGIGNSQ
ncbi:MAG TPA: substrate-binding domain-containing protein [Polyangiaceae bacterium]|nr:substrate-binding domain-containing protein [Polyangiaceae bacterium]